MGCLRLILRSIESGESPPSYQASTILVVFFNVLMAAFSVGQTSPYLEAISQACGAASAVFSIIACWHGSICWSIVL